MRRILVAMSGGVALTAAALAMAGPAAAAPRPLSMREAGSRLSMTNNSFEDVYRIKVSPFGEGTTIRDVTLGGLAFPATGKGTAKSYFKDGRLIAAETLVYGTPNVNGIGPVTGTGVCTGGTFKHQHETCTYKVHGTYEMITGKTFLTVAGTYTPSPAATKKSH